MQQDTLTSGGTSTDTTNTGGTLPDGDKDGGALFLIVDAPRSYQEAMGRVDTDKWVEAITEEYNNLRRKVVFIEVECPMDMHVHEGRLVFAEKVGSDGDVTRKKGCGERIIGTPIHPH